MTAPNTTRSSATTTRIEFVDSIPGYNPQEIFVSDIPGVNRDKGAPISLRAAVASVRRPAEKLAILRRVDPKAQLAGDGNFIYTPPGASEPVLFDPAPGRGGVRELGRDVVEALPGAAELLGAIGGGVAGSPAGPLGAIGGAGAGGMAARGLTEEALRLATGTPENRTPGQVLTDAGTTAAVSAAGELGGRLVAPVGKFLGAKAAGSAAGQATRAAAQRLSVPLTAGMASGRRFLQNIESALASFPVTTGIMGDAARRATDAATSASRNIVGAIARGSDTSPGSFATALQTAAAGRIERFKLVRQTMDDAIGSIIPTGTPVPVANTQAALTAMEAFAAKAPSMLSPEIAPAMQAARQILDDAAANGGQVPFEALRRFRTTVGEMAGWGGTSERVAGAKQHLRELYGAIGDDIVQAGALIDQQALAAGLPTPGAQQAIELHDAFVRLNRDPKNPVNLSVLGKLLEVNPSSPSQWAITMVRDPRKAAAFRKAVTKEEWDTIAGSIFEDMGRASPGAQGVEGVAWSPQSFLTNWNRLKDTGREALFGGTRFGPVARDIDALARVAESLKGARALDNTSGTARALLVPIMLGSIGSGIGGFFGGTEGAVKGGSAGLGMGGATMLSAYATAKLLTSPRFVSAVRTAVQSGSRHGPSLLTRLVAMGRTDEELRGPINEYIAAIGQAGFPIPDAEDVLMLNAASGPGVSYTPR